MTFHDRTDAGRRLAATLVHLGGRDDLLGRGIDDDDLIRPASRLLLPTDDVSDLRQLGTLQRNDSFGGQRSDAAWSESAKMPRSSTSRLPPSVSSGARGAPVDRPMISKAPFTPVT